MKRRRGILLIALGAIIVAMLLTALWPSEEPEYQGKRLSAWLGVYMNAPNNATAEEQAADAVRHIGTNALPFLVKWMDYEQPKWRDKLANKLVRVPIPFARAVVGPLLGAGRYRAGVAVLGFDILREEAAPAVPALAPMLRDWNSPHRAYRALFALTYVGKEGLPALLAVVTNQAAPARFRCDAARGISDPMMDLGTNEIWVIRAILPCLKDTAVAGCIAQVLGVLKLAPEEVVPALTKCLRSPDNGARAQAANALGEFGTEASSAVPELLLAASHKDQFVRLAVTNALQAIAPQVWKTDEH